MKSSGSFHDMTRYFTSEIPSAVFRPTAENWCVSKCDVEKVHFEWNIQQFFLIEDQVTKSVEFQDKKRPYAGKWCLTLQRTYDCDRRPMTNEVFFSISRYQDKCFRVKMAILNKKREMVWPQEVFVPKHYYSKCEVLRVKKESILSNDVLLTDGSLTICCEIEYAGKARGKEEIVSVSADKGRGGPIPIFPQSTISDQQERLFEDMQFSDVTLNVHGRQFQAHKCILVSSSKVFEAMFNHPTKENITNQVVIEDIQPEVFHQLLRFIYTGRLTIAMKKTMAVRLFAAADKYLLDQLKSECESHLRRQMSADNCLELLLLNDQIHPADDLKQAAVDFFRRNPRDVMATDGWKKAKQEHPNHSIWVLVVDILEEILPLV